MCLKRFPCSRLKLCSNANSRDCIELQFGCGTTPQFDNINDITQSTPCPHCLVWIQDRSRLQHTVMTAVKMISAESGSSSPCTQTLHWRPYALFFVHTFESNSLCVLTWPVKPILIIHSLSSRLNTQSPNTSVTQGTKCTTFQQQTQCIVHFIVPMSPTPTPIYNIFIILEPSVARSYDWAQGNVLYGLSACRVEGGIKWNNSRGPALGPGTPRRLLISIV